MTLLVEITHPSHQCRLQLLCAQAPYRCNGCEDDGFEPCYQCQGCGFYLHVQCAFGDPRIPHPFANDSFKFFGKKLGAGLGLCIACGKNIQGFMYQSSGKIGYRIHPCCMKPNRQISAEGICFNLREKIPLLSKCQICGSGKLTKETRGWAYVSTCRQYCLHLACAKAWILKSRWVAYFQQQGDSLSTINCELKLGNFTGTGTNWNFSPLIRSVLTVIFTALLGGGIDALVNLL